MNRKILVVDESRLIREYLKARLEGFGFEVHLAQTGFEGNLKIRRELPSLIIMDYFLSRMSCTEVLKNKLADPNARDIPVIMLATKLTRDRLLELAKFKIQKFFSKPIKIDSLISAISEILDVELEIDDTPCIIDVHFNDGILFVEVARGLNAEKIDLLPYKITEILKLYQVAVPKILIMMTDLQLGPADNVKLGGFLASIRQTTGTPLAGIRILTTSQEVKDLVASIPEFSGLEVAEDITSAMDGLLGVKVSDFIEEGLNTVKQDILRAAEPLKEQRDEGIGFHFQEDRHTESNDEPTGELWRGTTIAVVDDDPVIRQLVKTAFERLGSRVRDYENGRVFLDDLDGDRPDLILLDLMMPEADGFVVMSELVKRSIQIPIIVLSALSKKETVVRARKAGVMSYLIKPIKPELILAKTAEVLRSNF
jgi:CheY-like chemotaxis protein